MTPEHVAASRTAEVRRAARAWEHAGAINGGTREAIESAYPSKGHVHATAWRIVIFVIATVAIVAAFAAFAELVHAEGAALWFTFGVILAAATEGLERSSLRDNGAAGATSFWAVIAVCGGFVLLAEGGHRGSIELPLSLFVGALAFALACWRWGLELYGAFSAIAFFLFLAQYSGARVLWIAAALVLLGGAFRLLDRSGLAPEHRAAAAGVFAISAIALYAAFNRFSLDRRLVEDLRDFSGSTLEASETARAVATVATAILPLMFLLLGIRTRRRLVLDLGLLFTALSLVTLRYYVHLAPLWEVLCASGAALLILALALNRKLRRSPDGEWGGFTVHPLYSGMGALPAAAAVAGFAPNARPAPSPDTSNFTPGGGASGGGGATGSF